MTTCVQNDRGALDCRRRARGLVACAPAHAQSVEEFYTGKTIKLVDRLHARRRLRPLRPAGRAPPRQAHSGQAEHRRAEHAGRRQHARGAASLFDRAQGRHRARDLRPPDGHHAAAQSGGAIRRHQVHLARQRDQRSLHLRHLEHLAGEGRGAISSSMPVTFAGDGPGADPDVFANLYNNVFNTKIKIISGYRGTNPMILAMERGEVDGFCGLSWSTVKSRHMDWFKNKTMNVLVQAALQKEADIPDVPLALDLAKTEEQRQVLKVFLYGQEMARPFAAPPGIPADRKAALIAAFEKMLKDPEFLARDQEAQPRSQSDQRARPSTRCSRNSTPRRRMCLNGRRRRQPSDRVQAPHQEQETSDELRLPPSPLPPFFAGIDAGARAKRRGILQGQEHHARDRLHARRRLRSLCAASCAPHGQAHPGPPDDRAAEHGRRRQRCAPRTSSIRRRPRTAPPSAPSRAPPASIRCSRAARPSTAPSSPGSAASPTTSRCA